MAANEFKDINRYVSPENSSYSKRMNAIVSFIYIVLAVVMFLPVLLVIIISFSSEDSINEIGYSFFPKGLSLKAYGYLFNSGGFLGRAFLNSLLIT
ncbi:MAG: hypothetical protein J6N70_16075, partial [Oribacterium sp.]|nr:hypothetical protein [Oribacterium sp.]